MNTSDKIQEVIRKHLASGGIILGQCLVGGGSASNTLPTELTEKDGFIDLSMADVAGGAIAVGAALAGKRPIYLVRFQGFQWYNATTILNYAAKSKEMWGIPCPIFVRSLGTDSAGPVAGNCHHSIYTRMPGVFVCAPMTPGEYQRAWDHFMEHDDPLYVSEHRRSFPVDYEMSDVIHPKADITIFAISATRLDAIRAAEECAKEGIVCNIFNLFWLKPFVVNEAMREALSNSTYGGLVLDADHENGAVKSIGFDLMNASGKTVHVLALEERTGGFAPYLDNVSPSPEKIHKKIKAILKHV